MALPKSLLRSYLADTSQPYALEDEVLDDIIERAGDDLEDALAQGWRTKAATVAQWYETSIDGRVLNRGQVFQHCKAMAEFYESKAGNLIISVPIEVTPQEDAEAEFS